MSEKATPHRISSTELRNKLSHWMDKVVQGSQVVVSRRGKPEVALESIQKVLPLLGQPDNQEKEILGMINQLDNMEKALVIHYIRGVLESRIDGSKKK